MSTALSGVYRHYKGGLYRVLFIARQHDTRDPMVVYVSMEHASINVRPLRGPEGWLTPVHGMERFKPVVPEEAGNDPS